MLRTVEGLLCLQPQRLLMPHIVAPSINGDVGTMKLS